MMYEYGRSAPRKVPSLELIRKYAEGSLVERSYFVDKVVDLFGGVIYLPPDDLIRILKAGYRNMTASDRDEFMRKILLEMKRSER